MIDPSVLFSEVIWSAWGRYPEERSQAFELGAKLAAAIQNAGYRVVKQEQVGWSVIDANSRERSNVLFAGRDSFDIKITEPTESLWRDLP